MASNEEIPPDLFGPMTFSMEIPSLFKATATETGQPPMTSNLLNGGNQAIGVKPNSLKLKRYADIIKSGPCHKQETASVLEPTSLQGFALNSIDTVSATDEHDSVAKDRTDNVENSSSDNLKLEGSSDLDENVGLLPPILSQGSEAEKNQSPLKPRLWFEDSSEMFDAIDSSFTSSEDCSNNSSLNESADISSSFKSGDSSFTTSPEAKKAGFFRRLGARLLRKHKKKRTTSDELNESQQSTDTSSTSDDTSFTTCESKPSNQSLFEQSEAANTADNPSKSVSSSNDNCPTAIKSEYQKKESVLEEARLPIEAISPAGKRDHVRAEKRLRKYFASKKLTMPGSSVPKNRICWKDANGASNTSPNGSKEKPNGFGTKKVPYRPTLTEDDRTKQSIEKYWNYRIALFTKMTSSSLKCLLEEKDIPSNTPEIDYVELGLTGFVRNQFKKDTPNNPQSNNTSDTANDEATKKSNTSSSFVGKTESFTTPLSTITASLFRDELDTEAPCSSMNTFMSKVAEIREKDAGTSSPCRLDTSTSTADGLESPSRMTILSQISPSKFDGIEAARMQMKASLAAIGGLEKTVGSAENSSCNHTETLPLFQNKLNTSTLQTTPVKKDANTTKKVMKTSPVTNLKNKKEVFTPSRSRFSKYFTSTRKGYKLTSQLLMDVFQKKDQTEQMQISMPVVSMQMSSHPASLAETCSTSLENPNNLLPSDVGNRSMMDLAKPVQQKYKVGFGPKKLSLLALMKLIEERSTQKKSRSYWSVREDFRDSMTSRKVKHRKNRGEPYIVTEATQLETVLEEFDPTDVMIISPGKPASLSANNKNMVKATGTETQIRRDRAIKLLDAHLEDTLAKMKLIQMAWPIGLPDPCAVECTCTAVYEADITNCSSNVSSCCQFNPMESEDIEGAKEPVPSPDVSNAECDSSAFGFDVKTENVAVPVESLVDGASDSITSDSLKESTVNNTAHCLDSSSNTATSTQISPAKEDEIEAARKRMEAYLAKRGSQMITSIKASSPNSISQINQAQLDKLTGVRKDIPVEAFIAAPTTIASQTDLQTTVADGLDNKSKKTVGGQISPAKEDEIEAARIRMEAYLATKKGLKKPVISIGKSNDNAQIVAANPAELSDASKTDSAPNATTHQTAPADTSNCSLKNVVQGQISPAKIDEIEAARIRMEAYLAKKGGPKEKMESVTQPGDNSLIFSTDADGGDNEAARAHSKNVVDSLHSTSKDNMSRQISPAESEEIEAARIRMEAYLAKKSGLTKTSTTTIQFGNATPKRDSQTHESKPQNAPVKRTKLVAILSEGNPMSGKPQKPDVSFGDTPRLTPFVIIKLSEEQKAQPQYEAYWKKRNQFYQSLTVRLIKFRENKNEPYTRKMSIQIKSIPEEVITMVEVPIGPEKSESSATSKEEVGTDIVNDSHVRTTSIVKSIESTTGSTPPMSCHMNPMATVDESIAAPSKDTASSQISPAKDDEIEAARKRMEAFLAKKSDLEKKPFVVTPTNNSTRTTDLVKAVGLIGANEQPTNPQPNKNKDVPCSSVNTNTSQISPAKDDEIEAARKRMEAYIAEKVKGKVNVEPTSQSTRGVVKNATEQTTAESKSRFQVTSKQFAVTKPLSSVASPSSASPHENVPLVSDNTPTTKSEISPAKGDELAAAEARMKKFLEEKAKKQGIVTPGLSVVKPTLDEKLVTTTLHGNVTASSAVASNNFEANLVAEPQINVLKQISPAKASELAEAQKRMEAFLAKKKESSSVGKKFLTVSAVPLIARQANEKTPEKKDKKSVKTATSKCKEISPAKANELAEAKKRMEAFLANKQNGKPVPSTITASSASTNVPAVQKKFVVESAQVKKDEQSKLVASNPADFKTPQKPADGVECTQPKAPFVHSQSVCPDKLVSALSDFQIEQIKNPEATRTVPETITGDYTINCFFSGVTVMVERPQLSRVESSDHDTPEKLQVPVEDVLKVHYTDDFKKRISTPTKFIASQTIEECEQSPYSSPMKPEPTPEPVMNVTNVISHTPSSVNWLEAQMANLFGRQISMATSVPVVTQIVAPVVKQTPVNLSHSICSDKLTTALNEVWIKQNNEMLSRQNSSMTIKEPDFLKSCIANPDRLMDKVPEYFSPVKTPCQTPVKMQFNKRIRPAMYRFSQKDVLRVRAIKLPFPKRIKKSVSFLDDFKSVVKQPTFDEVVNGGGSGFRILSIEDHNANTVTFPKYVPPERFIPNSK